MDEEEVEAAMLREELRHRFDEAWLNRHADPAALRRVLDEALEAAARRSWEKPGADDSEPR